MTVRRPLLVLIGALLLVAGCDVPFDPPPADPPPTNPADPRFEGARQVSPPGRLDVIDATASSFTMEWTDESSFEGGYRVDRAAPDGQGFSPFQALPPNTTRLEVRDLPVGEYTFRVVATGGPGDVDSPPSPSLSVFYPTARINLVGRPNDQSLSGDGRTAYVRVFSRPTRTFDTETGAELASIPNDGVPLPPTTTARVFRSRTPFPPIVLERDQLVATLSNVSPCCQQFSSDPLGRRVATVFEDVLDLYEVASGLLLGSYDVSTIDDRAPLRALSPDGRYAVFGADRLPGLGDTASPLVVLDLVSGETAWQRGGGAVGDSYLTPLVSPDGRYLTVGRASQTSGAFGPDVAVEVLDLATGARVSGASDDHRATVLYGYAPDGATVAYGAADRATIRVVSVPDLSRVGEIAVSTQPVRRVIPFDDGAGLILLRSTGAKLERWTFGEQWMVRRGAS